MPSSVQEISAAISVKQHRWRAWVVNTQTSTQLGSHWFTVVVGTQTQLLQSTAEHQTSASSSSHLATDATANSSVATSQTSELPDSSAIATAGRASSSTKHAATCTNLNNYPNLFDSPDLVISDALCWAHANAMHPEVASWLDACSQWDSAMATKEHQPRTKTTEAVQRPRHPMYKGSRHKRKHRRRDGVHPTRTQ